MTQLTTDQIRRTIGDIYDDMPFGRKYSNHLDLIEQWSRILANLEQADLTRFQAQCMVKL